MWTGPGKILLSGNENFFDFTQLYNTQLYTLKITQVMLAHPCCPAAVTVTCMSLAQERSFSHALEIGVDVPGQQGAEKNRSCGNSLRSEVLNVKKQPELG